MDGEKRGISKHSEAQTVKANANARRESIGFRCPCLIASLGRASLISLWCLSCRRLSFLCRLSCPSAARCLLTHQRLPPENGSEATVLTQASHSHHTLRNGTFRWKRSAIFSSDSYIICHCYFSVSISTHCSYNFIPIELCQLLSLLLDFNLFTYPHRRFNYNLWQSE